MPMNFTKTKRKKQIRRPIKFTKPTTKHERVLIQNTCSCNSVSISRYQQFIRGLSQTTQPTARHTNTNPKSRPPRKHTNDKSSVTLNVSPGQAAQRLVKRVVCSAEREPRESFLQGFSVCLQTVRYFALKRRKKQEKHSVISRCCIEGFVLFFVFVFSLQIVQYFTLNKQQTQEEQCYFFSVLRRRFFSCLCFTFKQFNTLLSTSNSNRRNSACVPPHHYTPHTSQSTQYYTFSTWFYIHNQFTFLH